MSFRFTSILSSAVAFGMAFGVVANPAFADGDDHEEEHFDIGVWNNGGILQTGGFDHDTETLEVDSLRVFEAHFGEDPSFPFAIDEPGVGGVAADMGLIEGSTLGWSSSSNWMLSFPPMRNRARHAFD